MAVHSERIALTGNEAGALALKQIQPDVVGAYPITPQTELMQEFAQFVADGTVPTQMILTESEHSAMSAVIGASAMGVRAATATCANGLALMWEMLFIAAGYRLPIQMMLVSRSLGGPLNINCDHSDAMGARETGWLQIWSENAQEVYDNAHIAVRVAEHPDVRLPAMVVQDGFITSHTTQVLDILDDETVRRFVGKYRPYGSLSDLAHPKTLGAAVLPDYYMDIKQQEVAAMGYAAQVIQDMTTQYGELTGRTYGNLELYRMDGAEVALVAMGSASGTVAEAVDAMREKGIRAGLVKVRVFRPFPTADVAEALQGMRAIAVLDRALAFGSPLNPLASDVTVSLMGSSRIPLLSNHVYGLGGRDFSIADAETVIAETVKVAEAGVVNERIRYVGLHE